MASKPTLRFLHLPGGGRLSIAQTSQRGAGAAVGDLAVSSSGCSNQLNSSEPHP